MVAGAEAGGGAQRKIPDLDRCLRLQLLVLLVHDQTLMFQETRSRSLITDGQNNKKP